MQRRRISSASGWFGLLPVGISTSLVEPLETKRLATVITAESAMVEDSGV